MNNILYRKTVSNKSWENRYSFKGTTVYQVLELTICVQLRQSELVMPDQCSTNLQVVEMYEMKKCYLLLITSTSTCAVHLEVTTDVKASSLLFTLCRFFARGGIPNMIIRGNFKAFKAQGANIFCEVNNRKWKFIILERSPGWGIL